MNTARVASRAVATPLEPPGAASPLRRGYLLGLVGVALFALTIPMTRLASGPLAAPQLSPWFVAFGRAAFAGLLAALYLLVLRAPRPNASQWRALAFTAVGVVFG